MKRLQIFLQHLIPGLKKPDPEKPVGTQGHNPVQGWAHLCNRLQNSSPASAVLYRPLFSTLLIHHVYREP